MSSVIAGFVDALNDAEKEAREKELETLNNQLLRLFLLTEVSLGLAAPFLKSNEIGGQSFSQTALLTNRLGISWDFTLNLHCGEGSMPYAFSDTFVVKGWSYSFSIVFRSLIKEIKFNLSKENLGSTQSSVSPMPEWKLFRELYFENNWGFYYSMLSAVYCLSREVRNFLRIKISTIQAREGLLEGWPTLFGTNVDSIVNLIMHDKEGNALFQKHHGASQAYELLISETCQALRDTKGFVKSKKLAEIRENLERKSKEIVASVNS